MRYFSSERGESRRLLRAPSRDFRTNVPIPLLQVRGKHARTIRIMQRALLRWYRENGRDLPWRRTRDPYKVLVSEIMLQQTQVDRVLPKYQAFLRAFPTMQHLSRASLGGVIRLWAGLGYNRRAVYLHEAAKKVMRDFSGKVPETIDALRSLPGVGEYTAGAVACFAGGKRIAFLDINIKRVFGRLFFNTTQRRLPNEKTLFALAPHLIPRTKNNAYAWHHALMDLGALVCVAAKPKCETCPLKRVCHFPPFRGIVTKSHYAKLQPLFRDSDRFWRGRILDRVRRQKRGVTLAFLRRIFAIPRRRIAKITQGLVRDGLLSFQKNTFSLPE